MALTIISQFIWPTEWWFFWPLLIWTLVIFLHFIVIKTIYVDEKWVDERTDQLTDNAFDFGHIATIREQITKKTYGEAYGHQEEDKDPKNK